MFFMRITDLLDLEGIVLSASVSNKEEAIHMLASGPHYFGALIDPANARADILARERQGTTALPGGIAIPHTKSRAVSKLCITVITVPGGVDFGAPDGELSRLIFLLIGPEHDPSGYLDMLSSLLTLLKNNPDLSEQLIVAKTSGEFLSLLRAAEEK
jgi:PTS system fructose-specific IIC component